MTMGSREIRVQLGFLEVYNNRLIETVRKMSWNIRKTHVEIGVYSGKDVLCYNKC